MVRQLFAATALAGAAFATPALAVPSYDHIVIVIEENEPLGQVLGNPGVPAPFLNGLVSGGTLLQNSHGDAHDSEPNYLYLFSGNPQGIGPAFALPGLQSTNTSVLIGAGNNGFPPATGAPLSGINADGMPNGSGNLPLTGPNLGAELIRHGKSFIGYSEGLPFDGSRAPNQDTNCEIVDAQGNCHNFDPNITSVLFPNASQQRTLNRGPWVQWQDTNDANSVLSNPGSNTLPASTNLTFKSFPGQQNNNPGQPDFSTLPSVSIVLPNRVDDGHDPNPNSPACASTDIPCLQSQVNAQIGDSDLWLQKNLGAYAAWAATHNSLLIVTWDEDDSSFFTNHGIRNVVTFNAAAGDILTDADGKTPLGVVIGPDGKPRQEVRYINHIPTILYGAGVKPNFKDGEFVDHCGMLRTIEQSMGIDTLTDDSSQTCDVNAAPLTFAYDLKCDANSDGQVDRNDIAAIMKSLNIKVTLGDPRDADQDGVVTIADARACTNLCTKAGCAP
ncbi:MAG TPA: alkaline phosphatase family protein [Aliidongia sp.]|nr:alkaline phosphatase family protein [Aliidongia sp.]